MRLKATFLIIIILSLFSSCSPDSERKTKSLYSTDASTRSISHTQFHHILQKFVSNNGQVNYRDLIKDSVSLNQYLQLLTQNPPGSNWPQNQKLAYWINAYNAFTLQLVLRHYPIISIKDIGSKIQIPFVNTPWDIAFIKIGSKQLNLNEIEHEILRKEFAEPRIHFAIVCASMSCPKLRNEAYTASRIYQQLNNQAQLFINDSSRNILKPDKIQISKIFSWFKGDFTQKGSLINYLNQYSRVKINPNAQVSTLSYNWNLNE